MKRPLLCALGLAAVLAGGAYTPFPAQAAGEPADQQDQRLARAEVLAGLTPVQGPGLVVKLHNNLRTPPRGVDRKALQVHEQDFNAILNTLRAAGAEALAIAGDGSVQAERVLVSTAAVEGYNGLVINGVTLRQPFRIMAIGEPDRLRLELFRVGGVVKKSGLDVLQMIEVENAPALTLPSARVQPELRFAKVSTEEPGPLPTYTTSPVEANATNPPSSPSFPEPAAGHVTGVVRRTPGSVVRPQPMPQVVDNHVPETVVIPDPPKVAPKPVEKPVVVEKPVKPVEKPIVVEKPAPKPAVVSSTGGVFGGRGLAKFHLPGCRYGERIDQAQRVYFATEQEAIQKGRTPCPICHAN